MPMKEELECAELISQNVTFRIKIPKRGMKENRSEVWEEAVDDPCGVR